MRSMSRVASWRVALAVGWSLACGPLVLAALVAPHGVWWAIGIYHAGCCAAAAAAPGPAGPRPAAARLALAALASAALAAAFAAAVATLDHVRPLLERWRDWGLAPPADVVWLAYYAAVNPWVEERYWRGSLLGPAVRARLGGRAARAFSTLGFLNHHAFVIVATFGAGLGAALCVPILAAAVVWTLWRERTGGIWWAVASHAGVDVGLALVTLAVVRR
jgi:hypothetical protein